MTRGRSTDRDGEGTRTLASIGSDTTRQRMLAIGLMCTAFMMFSGLDAAAKYLSAEFHTVQIVWMRNAVNMLIVVAIVSPRGTVRSLRAHSTLIQVARGMLLLGSTVFNFIALTYLPLAVTVSIMFTAPFIITALSIPILGEKVGPRRWAAIVAGFLGVVLITRPGLGGLHWAAILSFCAALCFSLYSVLTRMVSHRDSDRTSWVYSALVATALITPVVPFFWRSPDLWLYWTLMVSMGVFGAIGHYVHISAHRSAPSSVLAPFMYTQIGWMIGLGYFVFGHVPALTTIFGVAIIIASGLYLFHRERVVKGEVP